MPLTNAQYDSIMRIYEDRRLQSARILEARTREVYAAIPRLKEIDDEISSLSLKKARLLLGRNEDGGASRAEGDFDLKQAIADLGEEREALLLSRGYPADYLQSAFTCPECKDTGYIDREKCSCFRRMEMDLLYRDSNLGISLARDNFDTFSPDYYSDEPQEALNGASPREMAETAFRKCRDFAESFPCEGESFYFYGDTGVGKTFLSHCIAARLLERGFRVLYLTATDLFEVIRGHEFSDGGNHSAVYDYIFSCDLLIIDDLGTELANSFTVSSLFVCVNERINSRRSTIISSNKSIREIADLYSERLSSRILGNYHIIYLAGNDIRIRNSIS